MTQKRAEKLNLIVQCVHAAGGVGLTRREIADCLGVKYTPYLLTLIKQVIDAGWMTAHSEDCGSFKRWRYFPSSPDNLPAAADYGP